MILRELREQKRISQQALGELFEVSAQTINNWECGKAEPDFEALMGLALFFGVSVDTLIGFDVKGSLILQDTARTMIAERRDGFN